MDQSFVNNAREWAKGKTYAEINAEAQKQGLTAADVGSILGFSKDQVKSAGYGTTSGITADLAGQTWGGYKPSSIATSPSAAPAYGAPTAYAAPNQTPTPTDDDVRNWFRTNASASDGDVRKAMEQYGVSFDQLSRVTGVPMSEVTKRYNAARAADPTLKPSFVAGPSVPQASTPPGAQQPDQDRVQSWFAANPNATDFDIADAMRRYNVSPGLVSAATGTPASEVTARYASAFPSPAAGQYGAPESGINLSRIVDPQRWGVESNQTVSSQLERLLANDSPLLQQARMRAMQTANQRGLLNSSMAASAGESALYDAALPIAQQDATTYSNAGRFNAETANTFGRDNNAFTRDAFMADFNLAANEWAKKQDQLRELDKLNVTQRLTLERDAVQNGYQSARDAILNGYTFEREIAQRMFEGDQNRLNNEAPMARLAMQLNADRDVNALKVRQTARETITKERSLLSSRLADIEAMPNLSTDQKKDLVYEVTNSYNTIASGHIVEAGWDDSWLWRVEPAPTTEKAPEQPSAVPDRVGGDGA